MFKKLQTIYQLKKIKQREMNKEFLDSLRIDLVNFTKSEPAVHKTISFNKNPFILLQPKFAIAMFIAIVAVFSGGGLTFASQNSSPGDALYHVKTFSENVRSALTVNPEAKERLAVKMAGKRIEEIKTIVERKNADPRGINIAIMRLEANMAQANRIISQEKNRGKDISNLASATNADFIAQEQELNRIFKIQRIEIWDKAKELNDKINEIKESGDDIRAKDLVLQLNDLKKQKKNISQAKQKANQKITNQKDSIKNALALKSGVDESINKAKKDAQELSREIIDKKLSVPADSFKSYDDLIAKASASFDTGDYLQARLFAKQAVDALKTVEKNIDEAEDAIIDNDDSEKDADDQIKKNKR